MLAANPPSTSQRRRREKVGVSTDVLTFVRTSDTLGTNDCSNVTLTLVCAGTTLYDHAPIIHACSCQG